MVRKLPKQVRVEWLDACANLCDYDPDRKTYCMMAATVGFLVRKTRDEVIVVQDLWDCGNLRTVQAIPRGMVKRIVELKDSE